MGESSARGRYRLLWSHSTVGWAALCGVLAALVTSCSGSTEPAPGPVKFNVAPADRAADIEPDKPITVSATDGRLTQVAVTNQEGRPVAGQLAPDGQRWVSTEALGYDRSYTVTATGTGTDGKTTSTTSTFTTVKPAKKAALWIMPANEQVIGIGHPLALTFDEPVTDKAAAERAIRIDTEPRVEGAFHWFNDKEVRWRPKEFWKPGTRITIAASIYGKNLGGGVYGDADQRVTATVGDAFIARADGESHEMTVEINGRMVRKIPISLGKPSFPSNNGIHVVSELAESTVMDSTTFGLSYAAGGYRTTVQWATRISNGGEYVHAAPWSVGQQGYSNVSHGCINMSTEAAEWFFHTAKKGDVVIVTNSGGPNLEPWDGWGDWQMPWQEWTQGGPR